MVPCSSVLIVDGSTEAREVLRTALERRGMRVFEATRPAAGLALAHRHRTDVIVLDLDAAASDEAGADGFIAYAADFEASLIFLGSAWRRATAPPGEFVAKPYHYRPLVLKIEQMLRETQRPLQDA